MINYEIIVGYIYETPMKTLLNLNPFLTLTLDLDKIGIPYYSITFELHVDEHMSRLRMETVEYMP